jgi:RNA polymerase sigma-70 factor (ECF subfamily)
LTHTEFKYLFDDYFDTVRNYIYYRSGDSNLATDIAQETFLRVWEKQLKIEDKKEKALLFKIAGDLFVSNYRKQKTLLQFKLHTKPDAFDQSPEDEMQFEELKSTYEKALANMPEKQRVVFMMSRMDQLTYNEIAVALGLSTKAIEKRMKYALDYLKSVIQKT